MDLFSTWDEDGDGTVDKDEFRKAVAALGWTIPRHAKGSRKEWGMEEVCDSVFNEYDADASGSIEYREYVRAALRSGLEKSFTRVSDLLMQWDTDGSGSVDKMEWRRAIKSIGFDAPVEEVDAIFDEIDVDGGGTIDYRELNAALRQGASITLDKSLQDGAKGEIEVEAKNKFSVRKEARDPERAGPLREASMSEIRKALATGATRVMVRSILESQPGWMVAGLRRTRAVGYTLTFTCFPIRVLQDMFRALDTNGDGAVTKEVRAKRATAQIVVMHIMACCHVLNQYSTSAHGIMRFAFACRRSSALHFRF